MKLPNVFPISITAFGLLLNSAVSCSGQDVTSLGIGNWFTAAANVPEAGYRKTQFSARDYDTAIIQWEARADFWLPPFRDKFSWGLYARLAGIAGSKPDAWQNAWISHPGFGVQVYPFSTWRFQDRDSKIGKVIGPLRVFAEYNFKKYWGAENVWRPTRQTRAGLEYWKAVNVNLPSRAWWLETWQGFYWQSSNEFSDQYHTWLLGNSLRAGVRIPKRRVISAVTPYLAIESSRTKYNYLGSRDCAFGIGNCNFYWENRLLTGGGIRIAPSLARLKIRERDWLERLVIYVEYLSTAAYYGPPAPPLVPRYDLRVGVSASIGNWYR